MRTWYLFYLFVILVCSFYLVLEQCSCVVLTMYKRKRDPTFAASEKLSLIDLVGSHFNIVECKKTDATNMRLKNDEWRKIALEFNAMSNVCPREWTVLKNCWENLKKRAKQQQTLRNQHFLGTGTYISLFVTLQIIIVHPYLKLT